VRSLVNEVHNAIKYTQIIPQHTYIYTYTYTHITLAVKIIILNNDKFCHL
jgi:uracil DNA glycosylase